MIIECLGGKKIILLCKDVKKADVDVCFRYHHQDGTTVKEVRGTKTGTNMKVHDSAIVFMTPKLIEPKLSADGRVHAVMFLRNTNDMSATFGSKSNHVEFYFKTTEFKKPAAPLKRSRQPKGTDLSTGELAVPPKSQAAPPSGSDKSIPAPAARAVVQLLRQVSADKTTPNSEDLCALLESLDGLLPELKQLSGELSVSRELGKMEISDSVGQVIVSSIETPDNSMTNLESEASSHK